VPTATALQRFQDLLRDLFQFEYSELDFGIYRLLRLKRDEVEAFLTEQLPRRVEEAFREAAGGEREALEQQLARKAEEIRATLGAGALQDDGTVASAFAATPMAQQYELVRVQLEAAEASEAQKAEVFNHLFEFFSRYYEAGDFVPRRYYGTSREHFAVPYNGEETLFTWANRRQHYVKTGEVFRDYAFTVDAGLEGEFRVRFKLTAADVPAGNTKGDTRYFFPQPQAAEWTPGTRTWILPFHYRLPTEEEAARLGRSGAQDTILDEALPTLLAVAPDPALAAALGEAPEVEDGDPQPPLLLRRMRHFARRNTSDYFIHSDLRGFLLRELEFYLKDRVLHLGDLDADLAAKLRVLRTVRALAGEVTEFLVQLEEVQRRLFEKRKLVLRTDWLVLIKDVPREIWSEVLRNEAQLRAWRELFAIDPEADLLNPEGEINERFLEEHPTLVVNTELFREDPTFTDRLLEGIEGDLDEATGGLLIQSENYQALRLLQRRYAGMVKCIYIDPPYNTGSDQFIYKDRYQHSSWLTMMEERLRLARGLMTADASIFMSIDDNEQGDLRQLQDLVFGVDSFIAMVIWQKRTSRENRAAIGVSHDYISIYAPAGPQRWKDTRNLLPATGKGYANPDGDPRGPWRSIPFSAQGYRPNQVYTIRTPAGNELHPPRGRCWGATEPVFETYLREGRVYFPKGGRGRPRIKQYAYEEAGLVPSTLWKAADVGDNQEAKKEVLQLLPEVEAFGTPKPVRLIRQIVRIATKPGDHIIDFFAGSGTTGHAVIRQNQEDGGSRRFTIAEMGSYFDSVVVPRIIRVLYAPEWTSKGPKRPPTPEESARTPRAVKILRLESYEDALHNLTTEDALRRAEPRVAAHREVAGEDVYRLRYLARVPLEENPSLLHLDRLEHPFRYSIEVLEPEGPRQQVVDLVETFSLVYGLHVERRERWTNPDDGERLYRVVRARDRRGQNVLVIWRDVEGLDPAVERRWLERRLEETGPWDEALCNADCATPGVRSLDPDFKRLLSEPEEGL
jgi:adenine-specific DNA-methyltransferase